MDFYSFGMAQLFVMGMFYGLIALSYVLFRTLRFIFSAKHGRAQRSLQMLKVWLQRITVTTVTVLGLNYACDVERRSTARSCRTEISDADGGLYTAELCFIDGPGNDFNIRLRLYSNRDGNLLAERTYTHPERKLTWAIGGERLVYNTAGNGGSISLPPSWMDRMRAKLP
ncbi:hypothetical protein [Collimonas humicola]|uniref:hypothetical protein n=1 Tax=Collimonas humicola TaxID=2825886 RepID=UPI001B8ADCC8|nr:hypothetical protein [Collimonas humicola]